MQTDVRSFLNIYTQFFLFCQSIKPEHSIQTVSVDEEVRLPVQSKFSKVINPVSSLWR
jgi:hypothetical protein